MKLIRPILTIGFLLSPNTAVAIKLPPPVSACQASKHAAQLIGRSVLVEGYVINLGSHGFALVGKRRDCPTGLLRLRTDNLGSQSVWWKRFATNLGPRRATLLGWVRWQNARFGDRRPVLLIDQVLYLSPRESDPKDF